MKGSTKGQPDSKPQAAWKTPFSLRKGLGRKGFHAVSQRYPGKALQGQHGLGAKLQTHRKRQTSVLVSSLIQAGGFTCHQHQTFIPCSLSFSFALEKKKTKPTHTSLPLL